MKRKKKTLKVKRVMYKDTYDPNSTSKYALKKRRQLHGIYSPTSPLNPDVPKQA